MLESSDVAVASEGVTVMGTVIGLSSVNVAETVGVTVANPPAAPSTDATPEILGVTATPVEMISIAVTEAETLGVVRTLTVPAARLPAATTTFGVAVMVEARWISANHPVIGYGVVSVVHHAEDTIYSGNGTSTQDSTSADVFEIAPEPVVATSHAWFAKSPTSGNAVRIATEPEALSHLREPAGKSDISLLVGKFKDHAQELRVTCRDVRR
jgi:hypothetical protein